MYYWSISKAATFAKEQTAKAASVKAWRITTKAGRALQEIARQMVAGKGYEIATDAQIFAKYGELCKGFKYAKVRDNKPRIWCICTGVADYYGRVSLSVVCVR
jgi:hypothetical protein